MERQEQSVLQQAKTRGTSHFKTRLVTAFVQTSEGRADDILKEYGCEVYTQLGDIAIATIPIHRLSELSQHPAVKRIEASPRATALTDTVSTVVNALPIYTPSVQHPAFTGERVVVGVMDIGFDLTHPNFYADATLGRYRVGAFWDMLSKDTVDSQFPVGRDFKGYDEVLAQQCSTDGKTQTHGTHTLGIAAGSGYDSNFRGMAFGSDICLVSNAVSDDIEYIDSADVYKYTTATDALGFKYIFDYADEQGKPCVASFSEGYGPYLDEDDSLCNAFLEKLNGPGRIIVSSAGNEGIRPTYFSKPIGVESAGSFIHTEEKEASYRIKSDGSVVLRLLVYQKDGTMSDSLRLASLTMLRDSLLSDTLLLAEDTLVVSARLSHSYFDSDSLFYLQLQSGKALSELPYIALVVDGEETNIEVYGTSSSFFVNRSTDTRWNAAVYGHNVMAPSCFPSVICVGSTAHRLGFTNYKGVYRDFSSGNEVGKRSSYSSTGPAMNGLTKPDVMAPGDNIISSYSSFYLESNPTANDINSDVAHFTVGDRTYAWNANTGTSMAAPVVAGIIALWLEACPTLTKDDVLYVLSRTCRQPVPTLDYPNNEYGYGEIDAYRGLLEVLGFSKVEGISQNQPAKARIELNNSQLRLCFDKPVEAPVYVCVYSLEGKMVWQTQLSANSDEATVNLPRFSSGVYAVQLRSSDVEVSGSQLIRL